MNFYSIKSEYINYHSINSYVRMKNKIIYALKVNVIAVISTDHKNIQICLNNSREHLTTRGFGRGNLLIDPIFTDVGCN